MEDRNKAIVILATIFLIAINIIIAYAVGVGIRNVIIAQIKIKEIEASIQTSHITDHTTDGTTLNDAVSE